MNALLQEREHPFAGLDVPWLLKMQTQASPHKTLLTWVPFDRPAEAYSYARFEALSLRLAAALSARGIGAGDRVLVHLENCPEFLLSWFALAHLGAVAVTSNTRCTAHELRYFLEHSECVAAITQPSLLEAVTQAGAGLKWVLCTDHNAGVPASPSALPERAERFDNVLQSAPAGFERDAQADPTRALCVQYTSGTTSRPKGVLMTHGNALWAGRVGVAHERLTGSDVHLIYAPLFHVNALAYSFLPALWAGASVVLQPRFSSSRFWSVACEHGTTWASMIPFASRALNAVERPKWQPFRCWGSGAAGVPLAKELGIPMMGWYGMTETISQPIVGDPCLPNREGCMGRAAPEYGVRIVNDNGWLCEIGETGLLQVRGVMGLSLFAGYLNDEPATRKAFDHEGWFITGDKVTRLASGDIAFAGRDKDMLKVGGENVSPLEVEQTIVGVAGVAEVAVVSRPHALLGEVAVAFVRLVDGVQPAAHTHARLTQEIHTRCEQALADFKRPREIVFVDEFPRATLNKISKAQLRTQLLQQD